MYAINDVWACRQKHLSNSSMCASNCGVENRKKKYTLFNAMKCVTKGKAICKIKMYVLKAKKNNEKKNKKFFHIYYVMPTI